MHVLETSCGRPERWLPLLDDAFVYAFKVNIRRRPERSACPPRRSHLPAWGTNAAACRARGWFRVCCSVRRRVQCRRSASAARGLPPPTLSRRALGAPHRRGKPPTGCPTRPHRRRSLLPLAPALLVHNRPLQHSERLVDPGHLRLIRLLLHHPLRPPPQLSPAAGAAPPSAPPPPPLCYPLLRHGS